MSRSAKPARKGGGAVGVGSSQREGREAKTSAMSARRRARRRGIEVPFIVQSPWVVRPWYDARKMHSSGGAGPGGGGGGSFKSAGVGGLPGPRRSRRRSGARRRGGRRPTGGP